ncbi:MAG TPA: cytochrome c oxidase subunit 3 [Casimicrobium huifangae]|jgi:cytochrome c oxidase subunit 3|uniref:cytochrome c oxidase subunit 3 n=1 Tax=Casimicrobium huifangae TaxID=2591109 RepID=UPI0012EB1567|nr:cytochrome c oxidase subunit 3 [Casimicrobium huifangae]HOB01224.1 cytochrome c oxidase subunit 3 [Casimicrobium huifangae]HQA32222.1 cytochrome c oxidase subunit 3 [Casimicrobium huifangae]HQD64373.1 cytochrome c oxidase subunit 3 [Casimicrobium huifangae]
MSASPAASSGKYFVPSPSHWPLVGSAALLTLAFGAVGSMNSLPWGLPVLGAGFVILLIMLFGWFGTVIRESEGRLYGKNVDTSFRWSMSWFIFSEVMFFAAFFGALGYARLHSVPDLGSVDAKMLWPDFAGTWPTAGPFIKEVFSPMGAWGIPAINTALLLTSGITLTIAHHALIAGNRSKLILWLAATIVLGAVFLTLQIYEYMHAYSELNLKLTTGIFGSTFFMLTGFHGFHVTVGAIMLAVILVRAIRGHFDAEHHFAFEAAAWYWHFVDVVWLGLFVIVYML